MQVLPLCHLVWVQEGPHTCMCSDIFASYCISDGQWQLCLSMKIHYVSPLGFEASICICICGINDVELPNSSPAEPATRKNFLLSKVAVVVVQSLPHRELKAKTQIHVRLSNCGMGPWGTNSKKMRTEVRTAVKSMEVEKKCV